jgi:hypothetical protein
MLSHARITAGSRARLERTELAPLHSITLSAQGRTRLRLADPAGAFAYPRQPRFASPLGARPNSVRGGTVFGANEAQVADDFVAAAMVRWMIDAVDHRHVGKIKRAHAL